MWPPVVVFNDEEARIGGVLAGAPFVRVRSIAEAHAIPAPAIGLENTARGNGADEGQVARGSRERIMDAIEAAAHIGEAEIAEQTLADAVALERGERGILRRDFAAIGESEAAQLQLWLARRRRIEAEEQLLGEDESRVVAVAVGAVIVRAEAERALRGGVCRVRRQAEQQRSGEFGVPIPAIALLGKVRSADRSPEYSYWFSPVGGLEPIPRVEASAERAGEGHVTDLDGARSRRPADVST